MSEPRITAIDGLPAIGPAAICMGVFDGVHRGHVALARTTSRAARERKAAAVALVFEPHPDEVVRPGTVVPRLAPVAGNLRRLRAAGIDPRTRGEQLSVLEFAAITQARAALAGTVA